MHTKYLGPSNYHPIVILISDGRSDSRPDTQQAIEKLRDALSGGKPNKRDKVWRFAIGVEGYDEAELRDFASTGNREDVWDHLEYDDPMVFDANDVEGFLRFFSTCLRPIIYYNSYEPY